MDSEGFFSALKVPHNILTTYYVPQWRLTIELYPINVIMLVNKSTLDHRIAQAECYPLYGNKYDS